MSGNVGVGKLPLGRVGQAFNEMNSGGIQFDRRLRWLRVNEWEWHVCKDANVQVCNIYCIYIYTLKKKST